MVQSRLNLNDDADRDLEAAESEIRDAVTAEFDPLKEIAVILGATLDTLSIMPTPVAAFIRTYHACGFKPRLVDGVIKNLVERKFATLSSDEGVMTEGNYVLTITDAGRAFLKVYKVATFGQGK